MTQTTLKADVLENGANSELTRCRRLTETRRSFNILEAYSVQVGVNHRLTLAIVLEQSRQFLFI